MNKIIKTLFAFFIVLLIYIPLVSAIIQLQIRDPNGNIILDWADMTNCSLAGSTETCFYEYYTCDVPGNYTGQVQKDGVYSPWTNLWKCEYVSGETIVTMSPLKVAPGDKVTITVSFNDTRYMFGEDVKIALTIDGEIWSSDLCPINEKRWSAIGWSGSCGGNMFPEGCEKDWSGESYWSGKYADKNIVIDSSNNYGKIQAECIVPPDLAPGTHTLRAVPTIYSEPTTLPQGETDFLVEGSLLKLIRSIFSFFQELFK